MLLFGKLNTEVLTFCEFASKNIEQLCYPAIVLIVFLTVVNKDVVIMTFDYA
jgi:hypothetical protein